MAWGGSSRAVLKNDENCLLENEQVERSWDEVESTVWKELSSAERPVITARLWSMAQGCDSGYLANWEHQEQRSP